MAESGIDSYLIPSSDPHISEYVPERYKSIQFLSGFTGSAGTLVITADFAGLWTDFRYFEQATAQLEDSGFDLVKLKIQHTPEYIQWLDEHLAVGAKIAFDFKVVSVLLGEEITLSLAARGITFENIDLLEQVWPKRPALPDSEITLLPESAFGQTFASKLTELRMALIRQKVDVHLISSLDDLAWLFNMRGSDVNYNPVVLCHALISATQVILYVDENKLTDANRTLLNERLVVLKPYDNIDTDIAQLEDCSILIDDKRSNFSLFNLLATSVKVARSTNPVVFLKSIKNTTEIENIRKAMVADGVALTRFFKWLEESIGKTEITELSAAAKIKDFREMDPGFAGLSFATIAGYAAHAALPHYTANEDTDVTLQAKGLFLLDSGGHYYYGTTDVTRTVPLGITTDEEKKDYTLVLSAFIFGVAARFPQGTKGYQIDGIVRQQLWQQGINYGHGTGHGVGYYLNVHEGPQNIGPANVPIAVDLGMVTSIEPGIYRSGKHGVRTENLVLTTMAETTEFGSFLQFESLTLAYIDTSIIIRDLLLPQQLEWLNNYNEMVYQKLKPKLTDEEASWLAGKCKAI